MEVYNSEQEQVEALKAWWDKNGKMVIAAIVVVLLGVLGWKSWQGQKHVAAENAATVYQRMMDAMAAEPANAEAAMELGRTIVGDYPATIYSPMASLAMGRIAVEQGDLEAAQAHLSAAMEQAEQNELALLARLRLSRVLLARGEADAAMARIEGIEAGTLQAAYDEQRGDILLAQGKRDAARDAYTNALTGYSDVPDKRELLQLKLDDLAKSTNE